MLMYDYDGSMWLLWITYRHSSIRLCRNSNFLFLTCNLLQNLVKTLKKIFITVYDDLFTAMKYYYETNPIQLQEAKLRVSAE